MSRLRLNACILVFCMLAVLPVSCKREVSLCRLPDADEWAALQTGDLVFCVGHSAKSAAVRFLSSDQSTFSHVGFVVKASDSTGLMCHMSADDKCIAQESLNSYITKSNVTQLAFYRLPSCVDADRLSSVLDSMLFQKVVFDEDFNFSSNDKLYCTEFIVKTLSKVGNHDLDMVDTKKHIYPSDLIQQSHLIFLFEIPNLIQ
ncbi:MAG: hypothetical protein J6X16_01430 [Bacteroidales bacterium]|nr:hypothetical protein [Bacteroidales bacterium]